MDIPQANFILYSSKTADIGGTTITLLNWLVNGKKQKGIYINSIIPYKKIVKDLKINSINRLNLYFIDLVISDVTHEKSTVNFTCIGSPKELTEVVILIPQVTGLIPDVSFVFIDSVYELIKENSLPIVESFMMAVQRICKEKDLMFICVMPEDVEGYNKIIDELMKVLDVISPPVYLY